MPNPVKQLTGKRFGRWVVIGQHKKLAPGGQAKWICICDCGAKKVIAGYELRRGGTKSCGCLRRELKIKHGLHEHKLYWVWAAMVQRCKNKNNKDYVNYGGRGIFIYNEWSKHPETFIQWALGNGWVDGLHIDRIDNNDGYCPGNCRFITQRENNLNQRIRKDNTTGFVGVYKSNDKYFSKVTANKKTMWLGYSLSPIDAAIKRNEYIISNNLKHNLNIIPKTT